MSMSKSRYALPLARASGRRLLLGWLLVAVSLVLSGPLGAPRAHAVEPGEMLSDPALEARARAISAGLRCLVCQNQSIDDSNAPLAKDLRVIVRERLKAGDSDAQIEKFLVQRYGEFVLLRPPLSASTLLLWLSPLVLLAVAGALGYRLMRNPVTQQAARATEQPLSEEETRRLDEILKRSD